ncbi:MAG: hypothetical protein ACE5I7_16975 [Candidatus Binatia bacterium]
MPIRSQITCPSCAARLVPQSAPHCPACGADVRKHAQRARARETRIEQTVAVISTILVVAVSLFVGGCSVVEGVVAYALAGAVIWLVARKTF